MGFTLEASCTASRGSIAETKVTCSGGVKRRKALLSALQT